ncbi:LptF/LptG family permease [Sulfurospirillum arcachonense]|uniref:LptF/LptG family permease n=1 Tax=Sulfurospirillum arcachonense TaxID=57666 RepID=UPI000469364A|nr:LptF/LptG family permease [Sulfurospirillum arcachonense]
MGRVNNYLLRSFSSLFSSLFFTLFFITSIVFFIKIASITSVIKITFFELGVLYIYLLPNILLYTLPVTFFIALSLSLFNLSKENETIVLFTLGYKPQKISKLFIIVASILSSLLIINILVLIPTAKQLNANFLDYKKAEAKFNIKATEFGQKFSNWLVYIDKSEQKDSFNGIVMFQEASSNKAEKIITATTANIDNDNGNLKLILDKGKAFEISDKKIEQINFSEMYIKSGEKDEVSKVVNILSYWEEALKNKKRAYNLAFFLLIALFPIATVLFALSIGIVTYRYEKNKIYLSMFTVIIGYLVPGFLLVKLANLPAVALVISISFICSYIFYRKKILLKY